MDKVAKFSPGQLKKGFTALVKYKQWLAEQGIAKGEVLEVDFAQYLKHVEAMAADMVARREAKRATQRRAALKKGRPPEAFGKEHTRSGARAAGSAKEALIWVRTHMGVTCVPLNTSQHSTKRVAASVREYTPIAPACMALIEKACTDPALSEEVKGSCAILVAIMSSSMRAASAARAKIPSTADFDGASLGVIEMDKNPNPDKMCAKVFVLDHVFIYGDAWHDLYTRIHASCPCMARATAKPGRPEKGGGWRNRPLKDSELLRMLRWVLVNVCGLTTEQSMDYSVSSWR